MGRKQSMRAHPRDGGFLADPSHRAEAEVGVENLGVSDTARSTSSPRRRADPDGGTAYEGEPMDGPQDPHQHPQPRLAKAGRAMALATLVSRVTGFGRTLALVAALGLGSRLLDAHTAANTLPNSIYDLVLGGALAGVLVPLLVRHDDEAFAQRLLSLIVYALAAAVVVTMVFAPQIVDLCAPGFTPEQRRLTITFTRFFLPQVLFYGVGTALAAVLNTRGRMAAPMWAPVANNLVVIATAVAYLAIGGGHRMEELTRAQTLLLSVGTTAGVAVQMLLLMSAGRRAGFRPRLRGDLRGVGLRRLVGMAGWAVVAVVASQAALLVANRLASTAGAGAVGVYANAYTLFQLPYAIITVSLITGVLPRMSRAAARRDLAQVTAELSQSLRLSGVALLPVAALLIALGPHITAVLFAHGNASPSAVALTGSVLSAYGLALVPFCGYQILIRGFYALGDTRTPALIGVLVSAVTAVAAWAASALVPGPAVLVGLAAGYAMASTVGLVVAALVLRARLGRVDGHRLLSTHTRTAIAAVGTGVAALAVTRTVSPAIGAGWSGSLVVLLAAGAVAAVLYPVAGRLLRITELRVLFSALRPA
ncbi:murein biosynthesis integral membrane protein MurJ [Microtetraspora niveoalba]|uniref:murein biosynthesis integral membrane protein MurJ n=1 Tax=Microtetraspora niveoalba TaxID=46175 RepID=UPI001FDF0D98|nr:murein biosynthesis integral membrane protein MurJ [Microtetraspora niveoalba]